MPQPNEQSLPKLRPCGVRATDLTKLLNALRALDRTVVEISMTIYKVPRRDRAALLKQHRLLHDLCENALPRFLDQNERHVSVITRPLHKLPAGKAFFLWVMIERMPFAEPVL